MSFLLGFHEIQKSCIATASPPFYIDSLIAVTIPSHTHPYIPIQTPEEE